VFGSALVAEHPFEEMYTLAARLVRQGRQRLHLVEELHQLSTALRVEGNGEAGAIVLRVMDCVGGWCTPEMRI
jgi:hypothetical protein